MIATFTALCFITPQQPLPFSMMGMDDHASLKFGVTVTVIKTQIAHSFTHSFNNHGFFEYDSFPFQLKVDFEHTNTGHISIIKYRLTPLIHRETVTLGRRQ